MQDEELQDLIEQDYEIGLFSIFFSQFFLFCKSTIKDKIIPHAISWITGEEGGDDDEADEDANYQSDESDKENEEDHKGEDNGHQKV